APRRVRLVGDAREHGAPASAAVGDGLLDADLRTELRVREATPMARQPFVLRMAGAPFAWLAELADEESVGLARAIVAAERTQQARGRRIGTEEVLAAVRASGDRGLLRAARTGRGRIAPDRVDSAPVRAQFVEIAAGWAGLDQLAGALRASSDRGPR